MPSFTPSFVSLCQTMEISASSRCIMRGKNSCSNKVSHFQYTTTPSKLEDSPVIFYLWSTTRGITHALSLPSSNLRIVCKPLKHIVNVIFFSSAAYRNKRAQDTESTLKWFCFGVFVCWFGFIWVFFVRFVFS